MILLGQDCSSTGQGWSGVNTGKEGCSCVGTGRGG